MDTIVANMRSFVDELDTAYNNINDPVGRCFFFFSDGSYGQYDTWLLACVWSGVRVVRAYLRYAFAFSFSCLLICMHLLGECVCMCGV